MSSSNLRRLTPVLRTGDELFRGVTPDLRLLDYWRWSGSSLMDNTARGLLAEFLVAAALGMHKTPRTEWDPYDVRTSNGTTIEVKSAAAIQSWEQSAPTPIQFGIAPRFGWDPETGQYSDEARRWADLYVFCVLEGIQPLDIDKWKFYAVRTATINETCGNQRTIRLAPLCRLPLRQCGYRDLRAVVEEMGR